MRRPGSSADHRRAEGLLTIGALSTATGIPIGTIRTWERRYGVPVPVRKPSGHRVYPLSIVPHLRRAAQAIEQGHRAAEVLPASEAALDALLNSLPAPATATARPDPLGTEVEQTSSGAEELLVATRRFDADRLKRILHS